MVRTTSIVLQLLAAVTRLKSWMRSLVSKDGK